MYEERESHGYTVDLVYYTSSHEVKYHTSLCQSFLVLPYRNEEYSVVNGPVVHHETRFPPFYHIFNLYPSQYLVNLK